MDYLAKKVIFIILVTAMLSSMTSYVFGDKIQLEEDAPFYLLKLTVSDYTLANDLLAYEVNNKLYIQADQLFESIEFQIDVNSEGFEGWFIQNDNRILYVFDDKTVNLKDSLYEVSSTDLAFDENNTLFIDMNRLEEWFNFTFELNKNAQTLAIKSSYPFPIQLRDQRASQVISNDDQEASSYLLHDKYHFITTPRMDISAFTTYQDNDGLSQNIQTLNLTSSFDFFKHSTFYTGSAIHADETETQQRLTFKKQANGPDSDIVLGADYYEFGDIYLSESSLVTSGGSGVGVAVKRKSNRGSQNNQSVVIEGDANPGWQVELFRNDQLIGFSSVDGSGRYVFDDVDVQFGENLFLVKLYGPQGQYQENLESVWGGGYNLEKNDYRYNFTSIDFTKKFIDSDEDQSVSTLQGKSLSQLVSSYAITDNIEIGASLYDIQLVDETSSVSETKYASTQLRYNTDIGVFLGEKAFQEESGEAWKVDYLTSFYKKSITISREEYKDFQSLHTLNNPDVLANTKVSIYGQLPWKPLNAYSFLVKKEEYEDIEDRIVLSNQLSGSIGKVSYSNFINYVDNHALDDDFTGSLKASSNRGSVRVSSELFYNLKGAETLTQIKAIVGWRPHGDVYNSITATKHLTGDQFFVIRDELSWKRKAVNLTFGVQADSNDLWSVDLGLIFSLAYNKEENRVLVSSQSLASTANVNVVFFEDSNNNSVKDDDERYIDNGNYTEDYSEVPDDSIRKFVHQKSVPAWDTYKIRAKEFGLKDPFLISADEYVIRTHAGGDIVYEVPLVPSGIFEANIFNLLYGDEINVGDVNASLISRSSGEMYTTDVEYDGYFSFEQIPIGQYILKLSQNKLNYIELTKNITITE